jgi:acetylglutamate kinase
VQDAVQKANALVEALGWIRQFRDRYIVIKLGGSALENPESVRAVLTDVIFMETVGMRPILVHGGGKAINAAMDKAGLVPQFVQGRRYTDEATLKIVARVLGEEICESLVDEIKTQGGSAVALNQRTQCPLIGEPLTIPGEDGEPMSLGRVGKIVDIHRDLLAATCRADTVPVIPSLAVDRAGELLNVNADTAAAALARLLGAEKLVFLSDVEGIFLDRSDRSSLQRHLTAARCRELIADGIIDAGMIPKVEAGIEALEAGVKKVHMVDARFPHSLLLEIYSDEGVGTEIVKRQPVG